MILCQTQLGSTTSDQEYESICGDQDAINTCKNDFPNSPKLIMNCLYEHCDYGPDRW